MMVFALADKLGKFPHEVQEIPITDLYHMYAYYKIQEKEYDKRSKEADRKRSMAQQDPRAKAARLGRKT